MKFERADISMINNVTEAEIITEFNKFGEEEDDFVVLSKNDMNYIQAGLSDFEEEGLILEYQEGSLDKHFHATETNITKDQVLATFLLYLKADASWKEQFSWEKSVTEEDDL